MLRLRGAGIFAVLALGEDFLDTLAVRACFCVVVIRTKSTLPSLVCVILPG